MKKSLKLFILLFILLALVLCSYFIKANKQTESTDESIPTPTLSIFEFDSSEVTHIAVSDGTSQISYSLNGEDWTVDEASHLELNQNTITSTCKQLLTLSPKQQIEVTDLKEFGLDQPSHVVTYTLKDGSTYELLVGDRTPDGSYYYAKSNVEGSNAYLIGQSYISKMGTDLNTYRNKTLESYDIAHITGMSIKGKNIEEITFKQEPAEGDAGLYSGSFIFTTPTLENIRLSYNAQEELLSALPTFSVTEFIADEINDLSIYGLDEPSLDLTLDLTITETVEEQTKTTTDTLHYLWGDSLENGNIYFMEAGGSSVYTMSSSFLDSLLELLDPFKLSEKWICLANIADVASITLDLNGSQYHFTIDEENKTYLINDKAIEEEAFKKVYSTLIGITADTDLPEVTLPNTEPIISYTFHLNDGSTLPIDYYTYDDQFYITKLHGNLVVGCNIKLFSYLEECLTQALQ